MASAQTTISLSVEEYLKTVFRPDVDFVDDHIEERNLGEYDHATLQYRVARYFDDRRHNWNIRFASELRVQTSARRFRVPDVCIMDASGPKEQIVHRPPLLCVEVLSPDDSLHRMRTRIQDFLAMGVPQVWILDPQTRAATVCTPEAMTTHTSGVLSLPGTPITLPLEEIFRVLDED